jgi:phage tail-like protein
MASDPDQRFARFNFLVALAADDATRPAAGFQDCSGLDADIVIHRSDAAGVSAVPRKLPTDVTLKRGAIDATELHAWLAALRDGTPSAIRTVRITLTSEDHAHARQTWTLRGARIVKYVSGPFNAKATDAAIEELTLSYEAIEMQGQAPTAPIA